MTTLTAVRDTWRMESVRLRTIGSSYVLIGTAVLLPTVIALVVGLLSPVRALTPGVTETALTLGAPFAPMSPVGVLMGMLGVLTVGHDYRFGLVRAVLTAQPQRSVLLAVRLGVLGLLATAVVLLDTLLAASACWLIGRTPAHDLTTVRVVGTHAVIVVLWTWLGCGLTWVMRGTAGPVPVLLAMPLLVEPAVGWLGEVDQLAALRPVARWLPFSAARDALARELATSPESLGAVVGAAVFGLFTAAVLAAGWLSLTRRDG